VVGQNISRKMADIYRWRLSSEGTNTTYYRLEYLLDRYNDWLSV